MAIKRYGKHSNEIPSSQERIRTRFANLKMRMGRSFNNNSFILEESHSFAEITGDASGKSIIMKDFLAAEKEGESETYDSNGHSQNHDNKQKPQKKICRIAALNYKLFADEHGIDASAAGPVCEPLCIVANEMEGMDLLSDNSTLDPGSGLFCNANLLDGLPSKETADEASSLQDTVVDCSVDGSAVQRVKRRCSVKLSDAGAKRPMGENMRHSVTNETATTIKSMGDTVLPSIADNTMEPSIAEIFTASELEAVLQLRRKHFSELPRRPVKIAEASFSEVFAVDGLVYKIIPFNEFYARESFLKEVGIMRALRHEVGACHPVDAFILRGAYTPEYTAAWEAFANPENAHPGAYGPGQEYGCLVMQNCGSDLESHAFGSAGAILCFFKRLVNIVYSLERKFRFEHRDLHWGNIMIRGEDVFIIDYSLSRLEVDPGWLMNDNALKNMKNILEQSIECSVDSGMGGPETAAGQGGPGSVFPMGKDAQPSRQTHRAGARSSAPPAAAKIIYTDLNNEEWLFNGDIKIDPQFKVYKEMRAISRSCWARFCGASNGLWIRYVLRKLAVKARELPDDLQRRSLVKSLETAIGVMNSYRWGEAYVRWVNSTSKLSECGK